VASGPIKQTPKNTSKQEFSMDMQTQDTRQRAEDGYFVPLVDQITGLDLGDGTTGFWVRGVISPTAQKAMNEKVKAESRKKGKNQTPEEAFMSEQHETQIQTAMRYIIRADDEMSIGGDMVGSDMTMIRKVLDMTFPAWVLEKDENGDNILMDVEVDGKTQKVPKPRVVNRTFAQQVIDAAEDHDRYLGN
jgi:hypothetical protein